MRRTLLGLLLYYLLLLLLSWLGGAKGETRMQQTQLKRQPIVVLQAPSPAKSPPTKRPIRHASISKTLADDEARSPILQAQAPATAPTAVKVRRPLRETDAPARGEGSPNLTSAPQLRPRRQEDPKGRSELIEDGPAGGLTQPLPRTRTPAEKGVSPSGLRDVEAIAGPRLPPGERRGQDPRGGRGGLTEAGAVASARPVGGRALSAGAPEASRGGLEEEGGGKDWAAPPEGGEGGRTPPTAQVREGLVPLRQAIVKAQWARPRGAMSDVSASEIAQVGGRVTGQARALSPGEHRLPNGAEVVVSSDGRTLWVRDRSRGYLARVVLSADGATPPQVFFDRVEGGELPDLLKAYRWIGQTLEGRL